jgi:hypothetical protein
MYMNRNSTVATLNKAGRDHMSVSIMSLRPLAFGTSLMMRRTLRTLKRGRMDKSSEIV